MRLKHEVKEATTRYQHRLIDLDQPDLAVQQKWVGFRTPAVWRVDGDNMGYYVAVTAYHRSSEEFPMGDKCFYYVRGIPALADNAEHVMRPEYRMMLGVFAMLDNYVEYQIAGEDPKLNKELQAIDRLEMFHEAMGEHLVRLRHHIAESSGAYP